MALAQAATKGKVAQQQQAPPKPQRISMNPDTFTAGGLINDIDITITDAQTTTWDMNGAVDPSTPFLAVEMTDPNGTAHVQYYSAGKPEDWQPEDSGEGFVSESGKTGINGTTNLGMFLASLVEAGFPKEMLDDGNLKCVIGTQAHVVQKVLERQGLIRTGKNASRPNQVLLVSKINALPGAGASAGAGAKRSGAVAGKANAPAAAVGKPNGKSTPVASDDLDSQIISALTIGLSDGEPVAIKNASKIVYEHFNNDTGLKALATKAVSRLSRQDFRQSLGDHGFVYDGSTLALAQE